MLLSNEPNCGQVEMVKQERCRPDYEGMITRLRLRVEKTDAFKNAALSYFDGKTARDKMAELIGELVTESASLNKELERLITAQESDA